MVRKQVFVARCRHYVAWLRRVMKSRFDAYKIALIARLDEYVILTIILSDKMLRTVVK